MEMAEGYITKLALDKDNLIIGYEFVKMGVMMDKIRAGVSADQALKESTGHYGRFEGAASYIDPRTK